MRLGRSMIRYATTANELSTSKSARKPNRLPNLNFICFRWVWNQYAFLSAEKRIRHVLLLCIIIFLAAAIFPYVYVYYANRTEFVQTKRRYTSHHIMYFAGMFAMANSWVEGKKKNELSLVWSSVCLNFVMRHFFSLVFFSTISKHRIVSACMFKSVGLCVI